VNDRVDALEGLVEVAGITQVANDDLGAEPAEGFGPDRVAGQDADRLCLLLQQAGTNRLPTRPVAPVTKMVTASLPKLDVPPD